MKMSNEEILMYAEKLTNEIHKYIIKSLYGNLKTKEELASELGITTSLVTRRERQAYRLICELKMEDDKIWELQYIISCYDEEGYLSFDKISELNDINKEDLKKCLENYINSFTEDERKIAYQFGFSEEALKLANISVLSRRIKGFSEELDSGIATKVLKNLKGNIKYPEGFYFDSNVHSAYIDGIIRMDEQFLRGLPFIYEQYLDNQDNNNQINRM